MTKDKKNSPSFSILLVDDEQQFLNAARLALASASITNVDLISDSRKVLSRISEREYGVIALDITMPHISGMELLRNIKEEYPNIIVLMITGINEVDTAVECMKMGAFDYLVKPVGEKRLISSIRRSIEQLNMLNETAALKQHVLTGKLEHPEAFEHIVTNDPKMYKIFQYVEAVAPTDLPILITGETGVGKELMARAIHNLSGNFGQFVAVDIAGLDDTMFSDTLFGHKRGAFTGAEIDRKGLIEEASNGTLFLDEIGDLKAESQVKLLRLIQEGQYYPLGYDIAKVSNARLILATNKELRNNERFRKDLFFRMEAHQIEIPPLRERMDDVPLLALYFLEEASNKLGKKILSVPDELGILLSTYNYPGNIRELKGMIYDAVSIHKSGVLSLETFKNKLYKKTDITFKPPTKIESLISFSEKLPSLREAEELLIKEALRRTKGNKTLAALILGMTRQTLNNRLKNISDNNN